MPDCSASCQSGTGRKINTDAGPSPVPDGDDKCRNTDAGGINLDTNAQL